ncbi:MAG: hypothetical protein MUF64_06770 [Polyangiaceae bacterium]|nr:hypothetical protein [Polyangiaceae bacterium]
MNPPRPLLILGMHRSGTSCLAAMLVAAGARVDGEAVRNWDNPRGHHEANSLVRLNEDVLAASGGHWLDPPERLRWSLHHEAERDRLLSAPGFTVWKDPRSLLTLPFWTASPVPFQAIGVVRHPLAVARSLLAWRGVPVEDGLRLWMAHMVPLASAGVEVLAFDQPRDTLVARLRDIAVRLGLPRPDEVGAGYAAELVHHDAGEGPGVGSPLLDEAMELFHRLGGEVSAGGRPFPWGTIREAQEALAARRLDEADRLAQEALAHPGCDVAAVVAPLAAAWLHAHQGERLLAWLAPLSLPSALAGLLRGKALLDARRPLEAAEALRQACAVEAPLFEARHLLPVALWDAGQPEAADEALASLLPVALYPFRVHARRAEWAWLRRDTEAAFAHLDAAILAAPPRRQGRLLHRRAAWRASLGDHARAVEDRALALERDPAYRPGR